MMNQHPVTSHIKLDLDPRFECSICLEHLKDPVLTSCGHKFCAACIDSWMNVKNKNYCPIDEVVLNKEDIFVDNYTRREILENNLVCPYKQCSQQLSIPEYETHVNSCYEKYSLPSVESVVIEDSTDSVSKQSNILRFPSHERNKQKLTLTVFPTSVLNMQVSSDENFACKFYQVGCREVFKSRALLEKHYDLKTSFHLELLFNQYCNNGGQPPNATNTDRYEIGVDNYKRNTALMNGIDTKENNQLPDSRYSHDQDKVGPSQLTNGPNDASKDSQSSLHPGVDSNEDAANSPFAKNQKEIEAHLMKNKAQESKLWDPSKNQGVDEKPSDTSCTTCVDNSSLLKLLYERIVLLEQSKLELEIKVNKLEGGLKQTVDIEDNVTLKLCNGTYYWKIDDFRSKLQEMTQTNRYFYSACFYSSCYGYRFCTRVNISREDPQHLSLFIHLVQGEHDDMLAWPFVGKIRFTALNTCADRCVQDEIQSDTNFDSFKRPVNFFLNKKAFGFNNFIRISDILDPTSGFLMEDDTFVIRTQVNEYRH